MRLRIKKIDEKKFKVGFLIAAMGRKLEATVEKNEGKLVENFFQHESWARVSNALPEEDKSPLSLNWEIRFVVWRNSEIVKSFFGLGAYKMNELRGIWCKNEYIEPRFTKLGDSMNVRSYLSILPVDDGSDDHANYFYDPFLLIHHFFDNSRGTHVGPRNSHMDIIRYKKFIFSALKKEDFDVHIEDDQLFVHVNLRI